MEKTLFQKIIDREISADIVYDDDRVCAFKDINPQAPIHILVIPKEPIASVSEMSSNDKELVGELVYRAKKIAEKEGVDDYRLVINNGIGAGQTVFHLHVHILAGRPFGWPPG